jgi:hypothetical protein
MNTKYAITATEQSSYEPNPTISNDNPINNNKIFCSQYLQTVLKITDNKNNNKHDTFNDIQPSLLLYQFIPIHPFIEYIQPEPEPPPLKSFFLLYFFIHWKDNKTKSGTIHLDFIILSQQHEQFNPNPYYKPQQ